MWHIRETKIRILAPIHLRFIQQHCHTMNNYVPIEADDTPTPPNPYNESSRGGTYEPNQTPSTQPRDNPQDLTDPANWPWYQRLKESSHPVALLFYIIFRVSPIFVYIFGNFILGFITQTNRFILHFIILILLISTDFWNVKNISGRLLVGLRWWNETNFIKDSPTGDFENVWVFESADPNRFINPIDSKMFWLLLYGQPIAWIVLGILAILGFKFLYLILVVIAISLSLTNAVAFTKCDKFGKANNLASNILSRATGSLFSRFNPFA